MAFNIKNYMTVEMLAYKIDSFINSEIFNFFTFNLLTSIFTSKCIQVHSKIEILKCIAIDF